MVSTAAAVQGRQDNIAVRVEDVDFYYGQFRALKSINNGGSAQRSDSPDRTVRVRQIHLFAAAQPDERFDRRLVGDRQGHLCRAEHL